MLALVVRFELKDPQCASAFDSLVEATVSGIRSGEPGTLVYATHTVTNEPLVRIFYEVYQDHSAFEEHERQPHTRRFLSERDRYTSAVRVEFLKPAETKGLPHER